VPVFWLIQAAGSSWLAVNLELCQTTCPPPDAAPEKLYVHWGSYSSGGIDIPEPNNMLFPENCAVANYTQRYGTPQAWGFADAPCGMLAAFICRTSGGTGYQYNATTNNTFIFTPVVKNFTDAEASCVAQGGHLASYASEAEQAEVEKYYVSNGYMFPTFPGHAFYWLGLNTSFWPSTGFPKFSWLDREPGPNASTYSHWGTYSDMYSASPEPNNARMPPELCAGANVSQAYGNLSAWGWADWNCGESFGYMCRMLRGWLSCEVAAALPLPLLGPALLQGCRWGCRAARKPTIQACKLASEPHPAACPQRWAASTSASPPT
jgi:hypothetical protein